MSDEQSAQRRLGRDLRELTADAFAGLARRFGWKPPVEYVPLGYETIGEAEFGYAVSPSGVTIEDETSLAGGQLEKAYEHHLFTNTCVNYIATRMAGVPLRFYRSTIVDNETQLEPADDHPVAKAFNYFNPHQSNYEAWEWLHSWTLIAGQGPMLKEPRSSTTPAGIPFELYPLYPNGLRPIRSTTKGLIGYRYALNGKETFLLPEDVVVFREFSTDVRFSAMGRLFAGRKEITTDLRAREWNDRMIKQGVHISGTLETEQDMSADKAATVREVFERKYAGSSQAHRIMVLHSGLKFNPTTFAHTDIGFIDQLKLTKEDIALAFGVPEELLGAKSANYASLREKRRVFWEDTIKARTRRIEAVMNSSVLPMLAPELVAYYDFSDVEALRQDQAQLVKTAKEAVASGTMTINEARIKVLELDETEGGDVLFIARGLQPLEAALAEAVELPPGTTADDGASDRDSNRAVVSVRGSVAHALESIRGEQLSLPFKADDEYTKTIRKLMDQTEVRVQNIFNGEYRKVEKAIAQDPRNLAAAEELILVEGNNAIVAQSKPTLKRAAEKSHGETDIALGLEGNPIDLRNTAAEQELAKFNSAVKVKSVKQWEQLRASLVEGMQAGESERALQKRVHSFFLGQRKNSLTIARTETARAVNSAAYSSVESAVAKGIPAKMEWNTVKDEWTRQGEMLNHWRAHGQKITPGQEMFNVSGESLRYPGDSQNGSAGNTINCRCSMRPVLVQEKPKP